MKRPMTKAETFAEAERIELAKLDERARRSAANARLIAAAPELLTALRDCIGALSLSLPMVPRDDYGLRDRAYQALANAQAARDRAEGSS